MPKNRDLYLKLKGPVEGPFIEIHRKSDKAKKFACFKLRGALCVAQKRPCLQAF
jgi:hypothetical protein